MLDMQDAVLDPDFSQLFSVKSASAGVIGSDGYGIDNTTSTRNVRGILWPATGREAKLLPEGIQSSGVVAGCFVERLNHAQIPDGAPGDQIYFDGAWHEVHVCEAWAGLGNFYRIVAVRLGQ
jgi:hypothetical protein